MSIVKSFSVQDEHGEPGDMFYIRHNSSNFTIIDCCLNEENRKSICNELKIHTQEKEITRFISTHPDEDHICGLSYLDGEIHLLNFYCVENNAVKHDPSESFKYYKKLRDDPAKSFYVYKGCQRKWMNISDEIRDCSGIHFIWPITENKEFQQALQNVEDGTDFNNISPIFTYSCANGAKIMWMGDIEHDFLDKVKDDIEWEEIDILYAPHHGRDSGKVPDDILKKLNPHVIVIGEAPSEHLNYYKGYNTIKQNSAGDIIFDCREGIVHIYLSENDYPCDTSFLEDRDAINKALGHYIGSFTTKGGN